MATATDSGAKATKPARGHRLRGSGGTTIRVTAPTKGKTWQSGRLYIGRALWQQIGEPATVSLEPFGTARFTIAPGGGDDFRVQGIKSDAQPRISCGAATLERLGVDAGVYAAEILRGAIVVRLA